MDNEKDTILVEEEVKEDGVVKEEGYFHWTLFLGGVIVILTVFFGAQNCVLQKEIEDIKEEYSELAELASEVMLDEVTDGNWYANCYRWRKDDGGIDFACYDKAVWDAPCMMSFRLVDSAPDVYGDQTNFILEVKEICPSN